jgi:hypothetical protein
VAVAARAKIIECLYQDEAFASATSFRGQRFHTCQILREGDMSRVLPSFWCRARHNLQSLGGYKARRNETKHTGRLPALSWEELDEMIADILMASNSGIR